MVEAFVFGKFLPFHKGHQAMINFALTKCDALTVLICCSNKELIPGAARKNWIEETFAENPKIKVQVYDYNENLLPATSQTSERASVLWSDVFKRLIPACSLLVTSEPYGELVSRFMGISHIQFDVSRIGVPVSSTLIRNNLFAGWQYLPAAVKRYYAIKVVLLGTESTGKTTLAEKLATHYNCPWVPEAARDIIPDSKSFAFEDLLRVAKAHADKVNNAVTGNSPLVIVDTDIHITLSYARHLFGKALTIDEYIYNASKAKLHFYLDKNVPHIQDGTRLNETDRNILDTAHRRILPEHRINPIELSGNWDERFAHAVAHIDTIILPTTGQNIT